MSSSYSLECAVCNAYNMNSLNNNTRIHKKNINYSNKFSNKFNEKKLSLYERLKINKWGSVNKVEGGGGGGGGSGVRTKNKNVPFY